MVSKDLDEDLESNISVKSVKVDRSMSVRFVVDGMLGSLARKLRIYGFDVIYNAHYDDETLLKQAECDRRVILTSDRGLFQAALKKGLNALLLTDDNDEDRMVSIILKLGWDGKDLTPTPSRCPLCNGPLSKVLKDEILEDLPRGVTLRYSEFYRCGSCGKLYWEGSHWRKIKIFSEHVEQKVRRMKGKDLDSR
ncbi:MAG: Mut7-C RNAse domain-containing protein [Nitrososphaerota archaeon]|nr:Mut7-C RNAse domain-containing protein [Nitrososphaerales archaeon]MCX8191287.1 Mut7-C RNAse domain-containing protein [Nitrososphaerales archaeon]MDW8044442.1 Mut7-C RNAse domain-containing protein [Nitrososphaerota archaeon]